MQAQSRYKKYKATLNPQLQKRLTYLANTHYGIYVIVYIIYKSKSDEVIANVHKWLLDITDVPMPVGYDPCAYNGELDNAMVNNTNNVLQYDDLVDGKYYACSDVWFYHTKRVRRWCLCLSSHRERKPEYTVKFAYHHGEFIYPLPALNDKQMVTLQEIRNCLDVVICNVVVQCVV